MKVRRIMISAPKSGGGKTVVTCALLCALKNAGYQVSSCKCGPDYIDPMFHEKVIGIPSKNLDTFFTGENRTRELFLDSASENGITVLEGVMGLFDGLGGTREEGSSYHLAKVTKTPIVFVVDARGMAYSVVPLIAGFLKYDKAHLIRGVILNRISKGYYEILKPLIEKELGISVLGFLPEKKELHIESRHLGLILPHELKNIKDDLQTVSREVMKTVSMEALMKLAESAEEIEICGKASGNIKETEICEKTSEDTKETKICKKTSGNTIEAGVIRKNRPVIAVAKDEAFCFYYADNIRMLEKSGAEIKYYSPIHEERVPEGCHALLFGGGYPELYAKELSENTGMRASVRQAVNGGMPVVAECGGFMYLHSAVIDKEGIRYDMADVIPATCSYAGKLVRFGYVEIQEKQSNFLPEGEKIKGHEFHYFDSSDNGNDAVAVKPMTQRKYACIIDEGNRWMGFPHLYYPSNPAFAKRFVEKAEQYRQKMQTKGV